MTQVEIREQMKVLFEALKQIEVKLQTNQRELDKAINTETTCKEGLDTLKKDLKSIKDNDLVDMSKFTGARKKVDTVEKFFDQSKCRRQMLEQEKTALQSDRGLITERYNTLSTKLSDRVLLFTL